MCRVSWLVTLDKAVLEELATKLTRGAYAPKERIRIRDELNILTQGIASREGAFLSVGSHWGDIIVSSPFLCDNREAKALGYCEVAVLQRHDFYEVLAAFPEALRDVQAHGLKLAVRRAMNIISMYARMHKEGRAGQGGKNNVLHAMAALHRKSVGKAPGSGPDKDDFSLLENSLQTVEKCARRPPGSRWSG